MYVTFDRFKHVRELFDWVENSRHRVFCTSNRAAQVTSETICKGITEEFNKAAKNVR